MTKRLTKPSRLSIETLEDRTVPSVSLNNWFEIVIDASERSEEHTSELQSQ